MKLFGIVVLVALLMVASVTMPVAASGKYRKGYKGYKGKGSHSSGGHSSGGHSGHGGKYKGYPYKG
uniref:Foot protein 7 variant 2 n=1 Tax=Mytilus californianus TaxID=6549 RepID=A0A223HCQ2_MYTCA|nr:foot protein 7 variant 2 [Mytilus californianus]